MKTINNILIISTNAIGDTYYSLSGGEHFRKHFKGNLKTSYLIKSNSVFLFSNEINFEKIISVEKKNLFSLIKIAYNLRRNEFDLIVNFFPGLFNTCLFFLIKGKMKLGYVNFIKKSEWHNTKNKLILKNINFKNQVWMPEQNYLDRIKIIFTALSIDSSDFAKYKYITNYTVINQTLKNKKIFFHFTSNRKNRSYVGDKTVELFRMLHKIINYNLVILDNENLYSEFDEIEFERIKILRLPNINELNKEILTSDCFVGVDSFPIHIADSYNKKIITLFSSTNPNSVFQNMNNKYIIRNENLCDISHNDIIEMINKVLNEDL